MFLANGWYTALWSHELTDKPVAKILLNDRVVLFRNANGEVGALGGLLLSPRRAAVARRGRGPVPGVRLSRA